MLTAGQILFVQIPANKLIVCLGRSMLIEVEATVILYGLFCDLSITIHQRNRYVRLILQRILNVCHRMADCLRINVVL